MDADGEEEHEGARRKHDDRRQRRAEDQAAERRRRADEPGDQPGQHEPKAHVLLVVDPRHVLPVPAVTVSGRASEGMTGVVAMV
jgi:hypothetical protein